jgi:hypothetical protein
MTDVFPIDTETDNALDHVNILDVVSRRTRVSYRDLRQSLEELQTVLHALQAANRSSFEDDALLKALEDHSNVQEYTLPTEEARREACVVVSNFVDRYQRSVQ